MTPWQINAEISLKHNQGGQAVLNFWRDKSPFGNSAMLANLGSSTTAAHERTSPSWLGLPDWYKLCPDILIVKGWEQDRLSAGEFPTPSSPVELIFLEYKTANDFYFEEKCQDLWDKYTPTEDSPRPHRLNLLTTLRELGWKVRGLDSSLRPGSSPTHDRLIPILIGHGAFIPLLTVNTVFRDVLDLRKRNATALARELVRHQAIATDRIMSIAHRLQHSPSAAPSRRRRSPRPGSSPSATSVAPANRSAAGIG